MPIRIGHPHACNEHLALSGMSTIAWCSSPRMRGAPCFAIANLLLGGIIPAYAGSTLRKDGHHERNRDHPRVRGEHHALMTASRKPSGSSTRTRGAPRVLRQGKPRGGIIPAYAGSTPRDGLIHVLAGDHPRVRGEHCETQAPALEMTGSSPRTRGALLNPSSGVLDAGIIPAYAGSTSCSSRRSARCRDHPRVRGEHPYTVTVGLEMTGSSPRTRGAQNGEGQDARPARIIPAYAGSTCQVRAAVA